MTSSEPSSKVPCLSSGQMPKIVRTDAELEVPLVEAELRKVAHLVNLPDAVSQDVLIQEVRDADIILTCYGKITREVIFAAERVRGIVKYGVGIDAIDVEAAKERGVPVVNVPEYAEETVAEGAFCLMISLAKKLAPLHTELRSKGWAWPTSRWMGGDLAEKTIGLVGCGRIGRSMARMAGAGFRMRVLAYDPYLSAETIAARGATKVDSLAEMLPQCDYVTVHCVLRDDNHHLLGERELRQMKRGAVLVNVSRGALVDELALLALLKEGHLGGAGLDVFSEEPLSLEGHPLSELFKMDNVVMLPHLTFYTNEAMERLEQETVDRCMELIHGEPVTVFSMDPRLRSQTKGVKFEMPRSAI